ncbi:hypothetical protein IAT38_007070 [Cryptococcus sp. DSM 104549]
MLMRRLLLDRSSVSPKSPFTIKRRVSTTSTTATLLQSASSSGHRGRVGGQVGIITGVGPEIGIGTSTAKVLCQEGAKHLYLVDTNVAGFPALVSLLNATYPSTKITTIKADAASLKEITAIVDRTIAEEGRLDFFFSNVGVFQVVPEGMSVEQAFARAFWDVGDDEFMEVMRVNTLSGLVAVQASSKVMQIVNPNSGKTASGGSIVLTSYVSAIGATGGPLAYDASKAGVSALAKDASFALAGQNIRVNAVCPGSITSNMTKFITDTAKVNETEDRLGSWCNVRRFGEGAEVAQAVLFLLSGEASYVNGHPLVVDGGWTSNIPSQHV